MPTDQADRLRTMNVATRTRSPSSLPRQGRPPRVAKGPGSSATASAAASSPCRSSASSTTRRSAGTLVTVSGCDLLESFFEMQVEPATAFLATYFAELVEEFAPVRAKRTSSIAFLLSVLRCLKAGGDRSSRRPISSLVPPRQRLLPDSPAAGAAASRSPPAGWPPRRTGLLPRLRAAQEGKVPAEPRRSSVGSQNPPPGAALPRSPRDIARIRRRSRPLIIYHMERSPGPCTSQGEVAGFCYNWLNI